MTLTRRELLATTTATTFINATRDARRIGESGGGGRPD